MQNQDLLNQERFDAYINSITDKKEIRRLKNFRNFLIKAKKVHGDKYDYSKVVYVHSQTNILIICPIHGVFELTPAKHLMGRGCQKCGGSEKHTKETFIEAARKVHGDKYDYSLVNYINNRTPVKIICPIHGVFKLTPTSHLSGKRCPRCKGVLNTEEFINEAKKVHGEKYDYSLVNYINCKTPVKIICPEHGIFEQIPEVHIKVPCGCPYCTNHVKHTKETFIEAARKVHGDKYDYSLVNYINNRTPVKIICPIHGVFEQRPDNHLSGKGCLKCKRVSKIMKDIIRLLENNSIEFIREKTFVWLTNVSHLRLDFYLPKYNIAIECHGELHFIDTDFFGPAAKMFNRDKIKFEQCQKHNIRILYYAEKIHENYELGKVYNSTDDILKEIFNIKNKEEQL